jgi:hypothetical protein
MPLRIAVVVGLTASCVSIAIAEAQSVGPLKVGDAVEVTFGGNWQPGVVTAAEGLTYFVHWGPESDRGKFDRFNHLYQLRQPGSQQTLDQTYHEKTADPAGGPVAIGETVEYNAVTGWAPYRVARRVGEV